ncbi:hypothetical protein MKW92_007348 [Papaver armeniacum]|nr:hypothetical protein MKW92_007348 [Papaver armeniacum]
MSFSRIARRQGVNFQHEFESSINRNNMYQHKNPHYCNSNTSYLHGMPRNYGECVYNVRSDENANPLKRRKCSNSGDSQRYYRQPNSNAPSTSNSLFIASTRPDANNSTVIGCKRDRSQIDDEVEFFSRDEIERLSPSRKDGIDPLRETYLRNSYCSFLQNLGTRLELPQTTIGTAMVLCHRFFVRRSHACHDRFLISTAALFLAAKSEETPCPLNNVLRVSYEICYKQDPNFFPYLLPVDWFEQYRERVIDAENIILRTLDFELNVEHPYDPLTSVLNKLGLSQTVLIHLALNLVSEGLRSSLWLQFKPHHIAAGAAYLAAKFLNFDLAAYQTMLQEFHTTPSIVQDVVQQLMELL